MHYYDKEGNSCHEVVGKNGKIRPTTLRDARQHNWVPSVTTIMDIQSKPALISWIQNQILEAAIASPFNDEWFKDGWKKYIIAKSREIGEKAAKRGIEIHDAMENFYTGEGVKEEYVQYISNPTLLIASKFPEYIWFSEKSFAHMDGFGGRVDLWGADINNNCIIIDFKTKDKTDVKDMVQYDDHSIQLAAYQIGLQLPESTRRFNLFISSNPNTPGLCRLVECTKFEKYKEIFYALLRLWQAKNSYKPEFNDE